MPRVRPRTCCVECGDCIAAEEKCACKECAFREMLDFHNYLVSLPVAKAASPEFAERLSMALIVKHRETNGTKYVENLFKKCVVVKQMACVMLGLACTQDYNEVCKMILDNMPMNTPSEMLADMIIAATVDGVSVRNVIAAGRAKDLSIAYLLRDLP